MLTLLHELVVNPTYTAVLVSSIRPSLLIVVSALVEKALSDQSLAEDKQQKSSRRSQSIPLALALVQVLELAPQVGR